MSGHGHSHDGGLGGCYHGLAANVGGDAGIACRLCDQWCWWRASVKKASSSLEVRIMDLIHPKWDCSRIVQTWHLTTSPILFMILPAHRSIKSRQSPSRTSTISHFPSNFVKDQPRIYYIWLAGDVTAANRVGMVNCVYKARPMIEDHKINKREEMFGGNGPAF